MPDFGIAEIAAIVGTVATVASTAVALSSGPPKAPTVNVPAPATPPPPSPLAPPAPDVSIDTEEQKSRQRAAQRMKELQSKSSAPSTILTTPLGAVTPAANTQSATLGR